MGKVTAMKSVSQYADEIMTSVHEDMASGIMPRDVGSFSEMHDHTDANMYLAEVYPEYTGSDADNDLLNAVSDEVDRRLAREALALNTGQRCTCGRLARFNGGAVGRGHWVHIDDGSHKCEPCQFCK
jgi:hypothetical protein